MKFVSKTIQGGAQSFIIFFRVQRYVVVPQVWLKSHHFVLKKITQRN